jgi:hypothetical protein
MQVYINRPENLQPTIGSRRASSPFLFLLCRYPFANYLPIWPLPRLSLCSCISKASGEHTRGKWWLTQTLTLYLSIIATENANVSRIFVRESLNIQPWRLTSSSMFPSLNFGRRHWTKKWQKPRLDESSQKGLKLISAIRGRLISL